MRVEQSHHIDASQPDLDGNYEWYYEYDLFRFTEGERTLVARAYVDSSDEAQFLRFEERGRIETIAGEQLNTPLLRDAARHLHRLGKTRLQYLGAEGFVNLPADPDGG